MDTGYESLKLLRQCSTRPSTLTGAVTAVSKTDGTELNVSVNRGEFTVGTSQIRGDCYGDGELTERDALAALQTDRCLWKKRW